MKQQIAALLNRSLPFILIIIILFILFSCRSSNQAFMTEKLFMQYQRPNIEYPYNEGASAGNNIATEILRSNSAEDLSATTYAFDDTVKVDTGKVYRIDEVRIQARSTFAPARNGKVGIDFLVRIPKELLSGNYCFTLTPELIDRGNVNALPDMVLYGSDFRDYQEKGYAAYEEYAETIVSADEYDKHFLDQSGISQDIRKRQIYFLHLYQREREHRLAYQKWTNRLNERYQRFNLKKDIERSELYHSYARKASWEQVEAHVKGMDTTGISSHYTAKFDKKTRNRPKYNLHREANTYSFPRKYRTLFLEGDKLQPTANYSLSDKDSVELSKHRYHWKDVEINEQRKELLTDKFNALVPYPYRDGLKLDTLFNDQYNFFYLYHYEYPITKGLKSVTVTVKSRVDAIDQSSYAFKNSDTLTYIVSSIESLMDTTLMAQRGKRNRSLTRDLSLFINFPAGSHTFDHKNKTNLAEINKFAKTWQEISSDKGLTIDSIVVSACTALDGRYSENKQLAQRQTQTMIGFLTNKYNALEADLFKSRPLGEDWNNLRRLIRQHPSLPDKDAILQKIAQVTYPDQQETALKNDFKESFPIIEEDIYPQLRRVNIVFHLQRPNTPGMEPVQEQQDEYTEALKLLEERDYEAALEILREYADYNTALCMLSMGYKENAYRLLSQLEQTADVHYLTAIVLYQLNRKNEAAGHLIKACELNPDKIFRTSKDAEIKAIIKDFNLQTRLNEISNSIS